MTAPSTLEALITGREPSSNATMSRRGFMRIAGLGVVAGATLAACGSASTVTRISGPSAAAGATAIASQPAASAATNPGALAAVAAAIQQGGAALLDIDYSKIELVGEQLAPNVYALTGSHTGDPGHPDGAGGRIGLLAGPEGVLMVDAQYAPLTDKVVSAIRKISPSPIRFLVNTHEHPDHTGGNANFAHLGALVLAREEERADLAQPLPPGVAGTVAQDLLQALQTATGGATDPLRLPVLTYGLEGQQKLRLNGETVDIIPAPSSHTHGDTIVRFQSADVMMIGDFYRNYGYPFVDPVHGGSTAGILKALDLAESLAGPNTKLVPGHGGIITKADLPAHRQMIVAVQAKVKQLVDQGKSLQDVLDAKVTAAYDANVPGGTLPLPGGGSSADRFVSTIYAELKAGPPK